MIKKIAMNNIINFCLILIVKLNDGGKNTFLILSLNFQFVFDNDG